MINDYLRVCEEAVRIGGREIQDWVGRFEVRKKGPADLVTQADLASQEAIRRTVLGAFPEHCLLGEEKVPGRAGHGSRRVPLDRRSPGRHDQFRPRRAALQRVAGPGTQRRPAGGRGLRSDAGGVFHGRRGPRGLAERPAHPHQSSRPVVRGPGRRGLSAERAARFARSAAVPGNGVPLSGHSTHRLVGPEPLLSGGRPLRSLLVLLDEHLGRGGRSADPAGGRRPDHIPHRRGLLPGGGPFPGRRQPRAPRPTARTGELCRVRETHHEAN